MIITYLFVTSFTLIFGILYFFSEMKETQSFEDGEGFIYALIHNDETNEILPYTLISAVLWPIILLFCAIFLVVTLIGRIFGVG